MSIIVTSISYASSSSTLENPLVDVVSVYSIHFLFVEPSNM